MYYKLSPTNSYYNFGKDVFLNILVLSGVMLLSLLIT